MEFLGLRLFVCTDRRRRRRRRHQRTPEPEDGLPPRGASLPALACLMIESINVLADLRRENRVHKPSVSAWVEMFVLWWSFI